MESGLSASDIALMGQNGNDAWGTGGAFMWIFALLILAGGGFGGWGNGNLNQVYGERVATQADIQRAVDFDTLKQSISGVNETVITTGASTVSALKDASYNNLSEIRDTQNVINTGFTNMQNCCCSIERAIDNVNYNGALNTASINANTTEQTQKILDAIATNRMADMQNQINQLQLQNAVSGVVRYPMSSTYCSGANPFSSGCGCSNI